jgi:hypothetical protein
MYPSYLTLRDRAPGGMSTAEQREADAQLGQLAAAVSQLAGRIRAGAQGAADVLALAGYRSTIFRKVDQRARLPEDHVPGQDFAPCPKTLRNQTAPSRRLLRR